MRLGVSLSFDSADAADSKAYIAGLRLVERTGFDSLWFFDSLGRGSFRPDPVSALSAASAVTEHIDIGTCILQVPLRHPVISCRGAGCFWGSAPDRRKPTLKRWRPILKAGFASWKRRCR